jgi:hypothetical protein
MILLDGVNLDETIPDQVRLHHIIFLEKLVLAAVARTNGAIATQTQTMFFHSGNKLFHMNQERHIIADPR